MTRFEREDGGSIPSRAANFDISDPTLRLYLRGSSMLNNSLFGSRHQICANTTNHQ